MKLLTATGYLTMPWKNGLGTTTEIFREDGPGGRMLWRVSMAGVAVDGPFSLFPGYDRHLLVVEGGGMVLEGGPTGPLDVSTDHAPVSFPGDWPITARLKAGPLRDFNLIVCRDFGRSELRHLELHGELNSAALPSLRLVHVMSGRIRSGEIEASAGDSLLFDAGEAATINSLQGTARLAACCIGNWGR